MCFWRYAGVETSCYGFDLVAVEVDGVALFKKVEQVIVVGVARPIATPALVQNPLVDSARRSSPPAAFGPGPDRGGVRSFQLIPYNDPQHGQATTQRAQA